MNKCIYCEGKVIPAKHPIYKSTEIIKYVQCKNCFKYMSEMKTPKDTQEELKTISVWQHFLLFGGRK